MAEDFQVTARKWRPMRFDEVVGQDHVTRTLKNALAAGRLAHAYLFTGQRGCGKTTVARLLAKAINCPNAASNGFEPCNNCAICKEITEGSCMDVQEIDGASNNGVDDVRAMRDSVKYPPVRGTHKVIIIDEVHMLSTSAFNALLKTLEEPPKHLVFIFATTEVQKVLPTILSRTQRYDFRRLQLDEITTRLRLIADTDRIKIDDDALLIIAKKGDGSMRDAQSIFDQVVAYCGMEVETAHVRDSLNLIDADFFFLVTDAIKARTASHAFELGAQIINKGYDIEEFFNGLLEHFRNLLTVIVTNSPALLEVSKVHQERYLSLAQEFTEGDAIRLIRLGQSALERLKGSQHPRITLEVALVEMMLMERAIELRSLLEGIAELKQSSSARGMLSEAGGSRSRSERVAEPPRASVAASASVASPSSASSRSASAPSAGRSGRAALVAEALNSVGESKARNESRPLYERSADQDAPQDHAELLWDDLGARWNEFVESLKSKRGLYISMPQAELIGFRRSVVYMTGTDDHTIEVLQKYKDALVDSLRSFFGLKTLSVEIGERDAMRQRSGMPLLANAEPIRVNTNAPVRERLEIEDALIAIGAKEV